MYFCVDHFLFVVGNKKYLQKIVLPKQIVKKGWCRHVFLIHHHFVGYIYYWYWYIKYVYIYTPHTSISFNFQAQKKHHFTLTSPWGGCWNLWIAQGISWCSMHACGVTRRSETVESCPMDDEPIWQCCCEKPKMAGKFTCFLWIRHWPSSYTVQFLFFLLGMLIYWSCVLWVLLFKNGSSLGSSRSKATNQLKGLGSVLVMMIEVDVREMWLN